MNNLPTVEPPRFFQQWLETEGRAELAKSNADAVSDISFHHQNPRWNFYIYVDDKVLDSLVDLEDDEEGTDIYYICLRHYLPRFAEGTKECEAKRDRGEQLTRGEQDQLDFGCSPSKDALKKCYMKNFVPDFTALGWRKGFSSWYYMSWNS